VCIMGCRSREWHSRKLYYLDVTYLNFNKASPYRKKGFALPNKSQH
jgi:hypothetical protein